MLLIIISLVVALFIAVITFDGTWNNMSSSVRNDLVFVDRFKTYGAYQIRQKHGKTLGIALLSTVLFTTLAFTVPMLLKKKEVEVAEIPADKIVEMLAPPPTNPDEPPPPPPPPTPPPPPPTIKQIQFTTIEVTEAEVEDPPPAQDDLENQNISNENVDGEDGKLGPIEQVYAPIEEVPLVEDPVSFAQEMATYPGGEQAMQRDIMENAPYPEMEKENNIQGKVYVQFVVEKDGQVTNVKVIRGVPGGPNLSKRAEDAVKKLKKFAPARQNGKAVRLTMTVPVNFTLK